MTEEFKKMLEKAKKEALANFEYFEKEKYKKSKEASKELVDMIYELAKTYCYGYQEFDLDYFDEEDFYIIGSPTDTEIEIGTPTSKNHVSIKFYYGVNGVLSAKQNRLVLEGLPWFIDDKTTNPHYLDQLLSENDISIVNKPNEKSNCLEIEFDASILLDVNIYKLQHDTEQKVLALNNKKKKGNE